MQLKLVLCYLFFLFILSTSKGFSQMRPDLDTTINNLIHIPGYETSRIGELQEVKKYGYGKQNLILIPGLGFDASVFKDFMEANKANYTMYAITIPGYGKTKAPPMPVEGTSYGEQSWNKGVIQGLIKFIEKEKIQKPVIVGQIGRAHV